MDKALKIVNELQQKKIIKSYAIGGGISAVFYMETILTYDLDILFIPQKEEKGMITLSPIYSYLKGLGFHTEKEHIIIEGVPVQFIPVYNDLIKEAVENAVHTKYKNTSTWVLRSEYIIAIMLQTFRPKDKERLIGLIEKTEIDRKFLKTILQKHKLDEKFENFIRIHYGK